MNEFLIAIGSNLGDRLAIIADAIDRIEARCGKVTARSSLYETAPVGAADQVFINGALTLHCNTSPESLLRHLLEIEVTLGRTREIHWGNRTIDLDILLGRDSAGTSLVMASTTLSLPHPRMLERDFVMFPACDIAGSWLHPESGKTLAQELAGRFTYKLPVHANSKL